MSKRPIEPKFHATVFVQPSVMRDLKKIALDHEVPIGEALAALCDFYNFSRATSDENQRRFVNSRIAAAFSSPQSAWEHQEPRQILRGGRAFCGDAEI